MSFDINELIKNKPVNITNKVDLQKQQEDKDIELAKSYIPSNIQPIERSIAVPKSVFESYADYDVIYNNIQTQEELDRERAKNQSWIEQGFNAVMQAGLNEVVLGTLLGASNIVDMGINLFKEKGEDDYTNPLSTALEQSQDKIREQFAIYRENPNSTFDVLDIGWWFDNAISIMSSASMLIPATGIAKGLGTAAKLTRANKLSRSLAKSMHKAGLIKRPASYAKAMNLTAEQLTTAAASRTMENYLEAREVYKETYDKAKGELDNMSEDKYNELIKNNPQFAGKDNDYIAKYIASTSADVTFRNDYAMVLFDFAQLRAISSLWKGAANKKATNDLLRANERAAASLPTSLEKPVQKELNFVQRRYDNIKRDLKNPLKSLAAVEWSEGIEEGYQGIQTEKGKERAEKYFNPNLRERQLDDYLADSAIWEQAFWGVLGGIGFQKIGTGLGNLSRKVKGAYNKKHLSEEDYAKSQMTDEKIIENEIISRATLFQDYKDKMQLIEDGKNIFNPILDDAGKPVVEDGIPQFNNVVSDDHKQLLKEQATKDFVTDLVINAVDVGSYDLLEAYMEDPNVQQYFKDSGINDSGMIQQIISDMKSVHERYINILNDVMDNNYVENENVAKLVARKILRYQNYADIADDAYNTIDASIHEDKDGYTVTPSLIDKILLDDVNKQLNELRKAQTDYEEQYKNGKINDVVYNISKSRVNKKINALLTLAANNSGLGQLENVKPLLNQIGTTNDVQKFIKEFDKYYQSFIGENKVVIPKNDLLMQAAMLSYYKLQSAQYRALVPSTKEEYQKFYDDNARLVDKLVQERYNDATIRIAKYLESATDLHKAQQDLLNGNVTNKLKEALEIVRVGSENSKEYTDLINNVTKVVENDKARAEKQAKHVEVDNTAVSEEKAQQTREEMKEIDEATPSSTGEEIEDNAVESEQTSQTESETTPGVRHVENPAEVVSDEEVENIISDIEDRATKEVKQAYKESPISVDDQMSYKALTTVSKLFHSNPNLFNNIHVADESNQEFNAIISSVAEDLERQGVPVGASRQAALNGVKMALDTLSFTRRDDKSASSHFAKLASQIAIKSKVVVQNDNEFAITPALDDASFIKLVDEFIESYVKLKDLKPNKNGRYNIDIEDVFNTLLEDNSMSYDMIKYIFKNMRDYVSQNSNNKYVFTNLTSLNKHIKNPDSFIAELIENKTTIEQLASYLHISAPSQKTPEFYKAVKNLKNGTSLTIVSTGASIQLMVDGIAVGYIAKVIANDTNTEFMLQKQTKGFVYKVIQNQDGTISSNMDGLFDELINTKSDAAKQILKLIKKNNNGELTSDDWRTLSKNELYRKLVDNSLFIEQNTNSEFTKVKSFIESLSNILNYDNSAKTTSEIAYSIEKWKLNIFNNYKKTHEFQNKVAANKGGVTVQAAGLRTGKVLFSSTDRDVSELGFNSKSNPIIAVTDEKTILGEHTNRPYKNTFGMSIGSMGYLLNDSPNTPVIALITDTNMLSSNKALADDVHAELVKMFTQYANGEISFNKIGNQLQELLGSYGSKHPSIFSGYSVIRSSEYVALNIQGKDSSKNGKYSLVINNTKDGINIIKIDNIGEVRSSIRITENNAKLFNDIAKEIVSNISFNRTFFTINNVNNKNTKDNIYIYKKNGKFVVSINGKERTYDNFSDFSVKENAFKTNQGGNEQTGYFNNDVDIKSLYINIDTVSSPVEEHEAKADKISSTELIRKGSMETPVSTFELLRSIGFDTETANHYLGLAEDSVSIIDSSIYYDSKTTGAYAYYSNGKVFFTNKGSGREGIRPSRMLRLLVHESIHAKVDREKLFDGREYLVDELLNTYDAFIKAINNDTSEEAANLRDWVAKSKFTLEDYFDSLPKADKEKWSKRTDEEKRRLFAEEWLAESLSQSLLMRYLNKVNYSNIGTPIDTNVGNKSLFQKIIEALLKLFKINNGLIDKSSILAYQYEILGNNYNPNGTIETDHYNAEEQSTLDLKEDTPIQEVETEKTETQVEEVEDEDIDLFATTEDIQPVLLAPNGKPSNLSPKLYRVVRTKEFKNWFGDWENNPKESSKVVDENGEPLVVYYGSVDNFDTFDKKYRGSNTNADSAYLAFFASSSKDNAGYYATDVVPINIDFNDIFSNKILNEYAKFLNTSVEEAITKIDENNEFTDDYNNYIELLNLEEKLNNYKELNKDNINSINNIYSNVKSLFLNIRDIKEDTDNIVNGERTIDYYKTIVDAIKNNKDGGVIRNTKDPFPADIYYFFEPNQAKSTDNKGSFSRENDNMYYATTDEIYDAAYELNKEVNPIGIRETTNMNDFINQFSEHQKPIIAKMIQNNELKFYCR